MRRALQPGRHVRSRHNVGPATLTNVELGLRVGDVTFPPREVGWVGTDSFFEVGIYVPTGSAPDPRTLVIATVDPADLIPELDETNNSAATTAIGPPAAPVTDSDGDGMADSFETNWFGTLARDGTGDYDHDGMADFGEFRARTVPTDDTSWLGSHVIDVDGEGHVLIAWNAASGEVYRVQFGSNLLDGTWSDLYPGHYAVTGGQLSAVHSNTVPQGFYRILLDASF